MAYIGLDGGEYKSRYEKHAADIRYQQQEEQEKLLSEQNKLLKQQAQATANMQQEMISMQRKLENSQKQMQQEQMQHEKIMQQEQIQHEEKMRILKLFDEVGLNKTYYDDFLNFLFDGNIIQIYREVEELKEKKLEYENNIENINNYFNDPDNGYKYIEDLIPNDSENRLEYREILENYVHHPYDSQLYYTVDQLLKKYASEEYNENKSNRKKNFIKSGLCFFASVFVVFATLAISEDLITYASFFATVGAVFAIYFIVEGGSNANFLKGLAEKQIEEIDMQLKDPIKYYNLENNIKRIKEDSEKAIEMIDKAQENLIKHCENISPKWNAFIEFRKNHYNSKIENLLIATGLKNIIINLGLEYPKININNKVNDGTVEDYIAYFDELSTDSK